MTNERCVTLYRDAHGQMVDIPPEFELPGDEVVMRKEGDRLILEPRRNSVVAHADAATDVTPPLPIGR